jgi:hypothetical protein
VPGLTVWAPPIPGRRYALGADPAEGNPNSDESAACVLDAVTWAEVAEVTGRIEPSTFALYLDQVGQWYNGVDVMPERNNHGHLLIRELQRLGNLRVYDYPLCGPQHPLPRLRPKMLPSRGALPDDGAIIRRSAR